MIGLILRKKCFLIIIIIFLASPAFAARLKIIDSFGLTRGIKNIKSKANVVVSITDHAQISPRAIQLVNIDGIGSTVSPDKTSNNMVTFRDISPGTWKVVLPKELRILSVTIKE
ncbi:MAG: hypothetical protein D6719_05000 [Candidatus Dadabacteria bacterium]|nr:MAG: hypothetical protein D6719_05000 [Candidatus Dadabacteria bacterium]